MNEFLSAKPLLELQRKLKEKFPELTDADLKFHGTDEQDMLRIVEYKLRKSKQEMKDIIAGF